MEALTTTFGCTSPALDIDDLDNNNDLLLNLNDGSKRGSTATTATTSASSSSSSSASSQASNKSVSTLQRTSFLACGGNGSDVAEDIAAPTRSLNETIPDRNPDDSKNVRGSNHTPPRSTADSVIYSSPSRPRAAPSPQPTSSSSSPCSLPKSGERAPSQVCMSRKLATAIAASAHSDHPVLQGRPTVLLPVSDKNTSAQTALSLSTRAECGQSNVISAPSKSRHAQPQHQPDHSAHTMVAEHRQMIAPRSVSLLSQADATDTHKAARAVPTIAKTASLSTTASQHTEQGPTGFQTTPAPLRTTAWSDPSAEAFNVRSKRYMTNKSKVPSQPSAFRLLAVDLVNVKKPLYSGICNHPSERFQQALRRERETGERELPDFVFAVNLCIPGSTIYHCVSYYAIDDMEEIMNQSTPFGTLMHRFMFAESDQYRDRTFKLIPRVVEGNFIVRKAVGSKPSILGKKIKQYYIRGERFFELIVDIASDTVAQKIVKLALGCTKTLVVDMMYVLEGGDEETLPERIFGGVRMNRIDFKHRDGKRTVGSNH